MTKTETKEKSQIINLPFAECLNRSFSFVIKNARELIYSCLGWFGILIYEMALDFPLLKNLTNVTEGKESVFSAILLLLSGVAILGETCRIVINKTSLRPGYIRFGLPELRILLYSLILGAAFILLTIIPLITVFLLFSGLPIVRTVMAVAVAYGVFLLIVRSYLVYPARAVGNNSLSVKDSFRLTKENANKVACGIIICSLPFGLLLQASVMILNAVEPQNFGLKLLFSFIIIAFSFLDNILRASFYAHIYQYFAFYDSKKETNKKD